jgi:capsular polysaccharide biosynthesis protein
MHAPEHEWPRQIAMATDDDVATRWWWLLRRHAAFILLATVGLALVGALLQSAPAGPFYRAEALVIASQLDALKVEQLPRTAAAVFDGGNVARRAVDARDLPVDPAELVDEYAALEPIEGTLLLRVVGTAEDPQFATDVANAMAEAMTVELNRAGPTIARFRIQEPAAVPTEAEPQAPQRFALAGALAGLLGSLGAVALVATLRRPILSLAALRHRTDEPVRPAPSLPRPGQPVDPSRIPGLAALVDDLFATGTEICAFVSPRGDPAWRSQLAVSVTRLLARRGPVSFVPSTERTAVRLYRSAISEAELVNHLTLVGAHDQPHKDRPIVIDGPSAGSLDVPQLLPRGTRTVLVVTQGAAAARVDAAIRQFRHGDLLAVVFVARSPRHLHAFRRRHRTEERPPSVSGSRSARWSNGDAAAPKSRTPAARP